MKIELIKSELFNRFPEISFGFSTKIGLNRGAPFFFNVSLSVDDDPEAVIANRKALFDELGLSEEKVAIQKQVHGNNVTYVYSGGIYPDSDALVTDKSNLGLAISSADCTAIFIYEPIQKIICGIHSGWRGTEKRIVEHTLKKLTSEFNCSVKDMIVFIAPSISQINYEVGKEVAEKFPDEFLLYKDRKIYLDVAGVNYKMLLDAGVDSTNIEMSPLCSYEEKYLLHSYRRDGLHSGRALGIISMKAAK